MRIRRSTLARGLVGVVPLALAAWGLLFEPGRLVVDRVDLAVPHWKSELAGLRVALLSDLHVGSPHWQLANLRELVDRANAEHPDVVLLAGDYVIDEGLPFGTRTEPEPIARELGRLNAPLGVIAVLGNHDWRSDGPRLRRAFESSGIVVLENEAQRLERNGKSFYVVGLADALMREPHIRATFDAVPVGESTLVLVHEPDVFRRVEERASITFAGHTHGGQVLFPFLGRLVVPSEFGERYAAGHVVEGGRHLFVTTGVGTSILPVRFGVPPELALLTLRPE
jgi:predicted MPP superfamily phosphohydrolase